MSPPGAKRRTAGVVPRTLGYRRARSGAGWDERCAVLFEDLRKPARVMIARAYGRALSPEEIEDVYSNAWASTLAALRGREATMSDEELRSYLLTAVAGHAGKEMRRRSRKPAGPLEEVHAQVLTDAHQPLPDERATGSETAAVTRDLLASLPQRRRAVMLLRYGWGLSPAEICGMVAGLSPRAYRKEVTRGVEQLIERLSALESGRWCESREPILRDYVAGVADEETRRQALGHMAHCRSCSDLVARLSGRLHELGSGVVLGTAALGGLEGVAADPSLLDRAAALVGRGRDAAAETAERTEGAAELAAGVAASGAGRGAGAAGAGLAAKLGGLGAAGKAAIACLGAGAAVGACIAAGVVPGLGPGEPERPATEKRESVAGRPAPPIAAAATPAVSADVTAAAVAETDERDSPAPAARQERESSAGDDGEGSAAAPDTESAATAGEQEFGLPSASPAPAAAAPQPAPATSSDTGSSGGGASSNEAVREFGP